MGSVNLDNTGSGDPALYRDNASSATPPSATGTNAVAIGDTSVASGDNSFAIGSDTDATGLNSIALGKGAQAVSTRCIALGLNASASGDRSISIGNNGNVATAAYSTSIGSSSTGAGSTSAGSGAIALGGAYASGVDSFAAAIGRNITAFGAQGLSAVAIGGEAKSTNSYGISIGYKATSTSHSTVAIGREAGLAGMGSESAAIGMGSSASGPSAMALGQNCKASGSYSVAIGRYAWTRNAIGKFAFCANYMSGSGDNQSGKYILRADTTDATAIALTTSFAPQVNNQVGLLDNSAYSFTGTIVARQKAGDGTASAAWKVEGLIRREGSAGTTVLVASTVTALSNAPSWGMALTADTTNGSLAITATGAASTNLRWVATINTSEVLYA